MLYNGEQVGNGRRPQVDVAVDPVVFHSLVTRSQSGTWRVIESHHRWETLMQISAVPYR
jgi:fructose-1,6-bisphosphatase/sedoheptulose 1,7-bisphosphatase-like protein